MNKISLNIFYYEAMLPLTVFINTLDIPENDKDNLFSAIEDCIISILSEVGYYE